MTLGTGPRGMQATLESHPFALLRWIQASGPCTFGRLSGSRPTNRRPSLVIRASFGFRHSSFGITRAFTLIELLVVIAILGMLAAMLFPALCRAKDKARSTFCINNGRQHSIAAQMYTQDNNDWLPPNDWNATAKDATWVGGIYTDRTETDYPELPDPKLTLVSPYLGSANMWVCPADPPTYTSPFKVTLQRHRSYSVNLAAGTQLLTRSATDGIGLQEPISNNDRVQGPWRTYGRFSDITAPSPAGLYFLLDVDPWYVRSHSWFFLSMVPDPLNLWDFPGVRHNYGSMFCYADGHAEVHQFKDARTWAARTASFRVPQNNPDNPDVVWMQRRTSASR